MPRWRGRERQIQHGLREREKVRSATGASKRCLERRSAPTLPGTGLVMARWALFWATPGEA